ncbi:hypothetical protein BO78DRAFT_411746 [Aspergillus sclerotiicarbonarius CBS 121057]|uniref:Rhodopsin domain-containing protein n=1 Tax=Aspergillus sclerotiicarbonarius (strain CBS 121057 / IBT 28362) TaxID=1448318 RepID=A0A319DTQ3_ASPSB|nr:hypothetical protein BO78DRAFT_411746 [Aspergillus sclerotiicarbonarius CBS 121057]
MTSSDNLQSQAIGLIFAFPAVATLAVALRIYSRLYTGGFALDDWIISIAGIFYWGETITSYYVIKCLYIGYHVWEIPENFPKVLGAKYAYATELLYNPILGLVKTSVLVFLLRLTGQKIAVRSAIWVILGVNAIAVIVTFFVTMFHCTPIAANWDTEAYPDAKCLNFANLVTGTAAVSICTDVLVLILPTWIVYNLHIPRRQRLMLVGVLSFGLLTVVAGLVRVILLDRYDRHTPYDSTHSVLFCISTIEVGLAFIAACAPSLKPLIVKTIPRLFASKGRSDGDYNKQSKPGMAYELDNRSRRSRYRPGQSMVALEPNWEQEVDKDGILTTELEVRWDEGSSAESLVQYP